MKENIFKELRLKAGLSQGQVAEKLGYTSPQMISNAERDLSFMPLKSVKKLAKIYGVADFEKIYFDTLVENYRAKIKEKIARA